jgi:hypothetical protein
MADATATLQKICSKAAALSIEGRLRFAVMGHAAEYALQQKGLG